MAYAVKPHWIKCPNALVVLNDVTNSLKYTLPTISFEYEVVVGNEVVKILDGGSAAANELPGTATGRFRVTHGWIPATTASSGVFYGINAAWFSSAFLLEEVDNGSGYYTLTVYRNASDASPLNFAFSKFDTFDLAAQFDMQGRVEMVNCVSTGYSADPLDGTAISLPASKPLGALLSYANAQFAGGTQVRGVGLSLSRNADVIPEVNTSGTNANLPYLSGGVKQGLLGGQLSLTQSGIATTVPGVNNAEASFTSAFGGTGYGVSFATELVFFRNAGTVDAGWNLQRNTFKLISVDGTNTGMIVAADL